LKTSLVIVAVMLSCINLFGQTLTEKLILADTIDSTYIKSNHKKFDKAGNFCFIVKWKGRDYFMTNTDTIGGFKYIGSTYGNSGEINYTNAYSDPPNKPYYYKNARGTKVYGTAVGKIETYITSNTLEHVAMTTSLGDSVYHFIHNQLIDRTHKSRFTDAYESLDDWCAFSGNGNRIFFLKKDSVYYLYVNEKEIDRSKFRYTQLAINNNGFYVYAKGDRPEKKMDKYDYRFFINTKDTVLGYTRTVWNYELRDNGAYYYSGDDSGPSYMAINDKLYKNIADVSHITIIDKSKFLYTFSSQKQQQINVNGTIYAHDFDEVWMPALNSNGDFAFYGLKNYYLFKYVNGQTQEQPLSKMNVRATPLYMSATGQSLHYFKTDDSIYIYRDDQLLFKPISNTSHFQVLPSKDLLPWRYTNSKTGNGHNLFYMEIDSTGYFVFNGAFCKTTLPVKERAYMPKKMGEIVASELNEHGYFAIQQTGLKKYMVYANNKTYEVDDIDELINEACFFDGKELIFYGLKNKCFYRFTLTL
jgi:hypothetical protein